MLTDESPERLSPEVDNRIPPGKVGWFETCADPTGETAALGSELAYDLGVSPDGAIGLLVAVRDADGRLASGALLNPGEAVAAGRWLLEAGIQGLQRWGDYLDEPGRKAMGEAVAGELVASFHTLYKTTAARWAKQIHQQARTQQEMSNAVIIEKARAQAALEARAEVEAELRERTLELARAAAAPSAEERAERLEPLIPWIRELTVRKSD